MAPKPPKGGSISPVPPPLQFANREAVSASSVNKSQHISSSSSVSHHTAQSKFSSSSSHSKTGVKVLPALNHPVQLQEPKDHIDSINSNEADHFIEQLMREAETDPKLRELTYGSNQRQPNLNETFPLINRPYRTAQDLKIQDHEQQNVIRNSVKHVSERHKMPERPYRTNEDIKIVTNRSKSADGRLHQAFKSQDPKLSSFQQVSKDPNTTEDLLNEVVTDKDHRSVKDLIAMMEQNTKVESINPYVRKWGCDLISPEPHKRNVTYRSEKRQIVDENELNRSMDRQATFTWKQDDLFKRKNTWVDPNAEQQQIQQHVISHQTNHHSPSGRDDHDVLDAHTTDLDDLLGRRPSLEGQLDSTQDKTVVVWPPPSPLPPQDQNSYPSPMFSPSPPPPLNAVPLPPSTPSPIPNIEITPSPMPKKSNLKKRSQSEGTRRFSNSSLHEIDQQIVMIQNEFEAELDTLIDAYRHIQHNKKKG